MPALDYDDSAFSFFAVSVLSIYTLSATIYILRRIFKTEKPDSSIDIQVARSEEERAKFEELNANKPIKVVYTRGFLFFIGFTVIVAAALVYLVAVIGKSATLSVYDPFSILGIDHSASITEIKKAYRDLSRLYHPDKGGDAEKFERIAKAYQTLTDDVARDNWVKFGNPDGRQAMEVSIGMPSILMDKNMRYVFLLGYLLALVVGIPMCLRAVWRSNKGRTPFGLTESSLQWIRARLVTLTQRRAIPVTLAETFAAMPDMRNIEYDPIDVAAGGELNAIQTELATPKNPRIFFTVDQQNNPILSTGRYNTILLHAHMNRIPLKSDSLRKNLRTILERLPEFTKFAIPFSMEMQKESQTRKARRNPQAVEPLIETAFDVMRFNALVVQGLYWNDNPLLQILTSDEIQMLHKSRRGLTIRALLDLPSEDRLKLLTEVLSVDRLAAVKRVLNDLPLLDLNVKFGVRTGEKTPDDEEELTNTIYEGNVMTAIVEVRHRNIGSTAADSKKPLPPVFAPKYPFPVESEWHVMFFDEKNQVLHMGSASEGAPLAYSRVIATKCSEKFSVSFFAPRAGLHRLKLVARSTAYVGLDVETEVKFVVRAQEDDVSLNEANNLKEEEEEEDEEHRSILQHREETMERLFANDDLSDVSDEEPEPQSQKSPAKAKSTAPVSKSQKKASKGKDEDVVSSDGEDNGVIAETLATVAAVGASGAAEMPAKDTANYDDGWAPSILTGKTSRKSKSKVSTPGAGGHGSGGGGGGGHGHSHGGAPCSGH